MSSLQKFATQDLVHECERVSTLLKELSHPQRLMLLCHLADGEKSVGELESLCQSSQSQMSQFLSRMKLEKLVHSRREGHHVYYRITDPKVEKLIQALQKIFCREEKR